MDILSYILGMAAGGGGKPTKKVINYEAIDATHIEITFEDETLRVIEVEYDADGKIIEVDGKQAVYDGDILVKFNDIDIDIEEIPGGGTPQMLMCNTNGKGRTQSYSVCVGNKVYFMDFETNRLCYYDTDTDTVVNTNTIVSGDIGSSAMASIGNIIFFIGGWSPNNNIRAYDTINNTLTTLPVTLPYDVGFTTTATIGTDIYIIGGIKPKDVWIDTILKFDTLNNVVTTLDYKLPKVNAFGTCVVKGNKIYRFGGVPQWNKYENFILCIDTISGTVTQIGTMPITQSSPCVAMMNNKIILGCGELNLKIFNESDGTFTDTKVCGISSFFESSSCYCNNAIYYIYKDNKVIQKFIDVKLTN